MASKARDLSNFISVATVDASEIASNAVTADKIADVAVTHAKLHTDMNLSGKTLTFATNQISGNAIDGGVISNFTSTGIDDNSSATAVTILSSGNVGIGDTTPQALLDVGGGYGGNTTVATFAHATDAYIEIENMTSQNGAGIILTNAGTKKWTIQKDTSAHSLHIQDTSAGVMTFLQGGNVGIGTDAPATTLNVKSSSYPYVRITNDGYTGLDIGQADSSEGGAALIKLRDAADMDFYTTDQNRMRISSTGNVGIGTLTTDPGYKLQVNHGTTSQYASSIRNTADNLQLLLGTTTGGYLNIQGARIDNGNPYAMSLQSDGGNVGIGATANLTSKLTVNAPAASHTTGYQEDIAQFYTTQSPYTGRHYLNMFHDNNNRDGTTDHTVWGMGFGYDGNTRGGIQYDHKGQERLTLWSSYGDIHFKGNSVGAASKLAHQANTDIMVLRGNGNVGINTTSASDKLHIKSGWLRVQAAEQTSGSHNQKYGVRWTQETDVEVARIEIERPAWSGAPSRMNFYTRKPDNSLNKTMAIDEYGRVTMPYQPNFLARMTTTSTSLTADAWATFNFNTAEWDKGSNFTASNYRFTAPVAGIYFFHWLIQVEAITDAPAWYYAYPLVNGNQTIGGSKGTTAADQIEPIGSYTAIKGTQSLQLAANDYVTLNYYWSAGNGLVKGSSESMWAGHLIG